MSFPLLVISPIIMPKIAKYSDTNSGISVQSIVIKSFVLLAILSIPILCLVITGKDFVISAINSEFLQATEYINILAFAQLFTVLSGPFGMVLFMGDREREFAQIQIGMLISYIVVLPTSAHFSGSKGFVLALLLMAVLRATIIVFFYFRTKSTPNYI